jgi:3D (Asp-Asp-Asp) domain-containing protein
VGYVAVDPKVIPLGSKLYITTPSGNIVYGMAVAADTGGAIKGNKIDLYYNTYSECVQFGRRTCTVYVLS